ncbi:hypothetical protein CYMTET_56247 [Cymbomonas tetramitiformis]|uniref:Glucosamine/galactosamine-6-phosphate isomerase domain-containing protein n=1 Tax=Cymbomonas tetramitiformis TaxID=36881 RepID=A0AAE0ENY6_9CHLO|nr:hypothetical protein CYMTET_56247 [Cymbomonas tetramitiformis]|eukprot:gene3951-4920_t
MTVKVLDSDAEVTQALLGVVLEGAKEAIAEKGAFSLAVPGGRIPTMLAGLINAPGSAEVDWAKCHLFFVNERQNEGKCCKLNKAQFADALGIPDANIYPPATGESVDSAAAYSQTLRDVPVGVVYIPAIDGSAPCLDMALIGLGNDGHIGSVYPGSETAAVADATSLALPVDKPGKQSITMSLAMMAAAKRTVIATCGEGKVESVAKAIKLSAASKAWKAEESMPWLDAPSARLAVGPGETIWLLDAAAGAGL